MKLIEYFQELKIMNREAPMCKKCGVVLKFKFKKDNIDKHAWKCSKCGTSQSIRNVTFLKKCDKSENVFLKLAYHWTVSTSVKIVAKELDLSRAIVIMWYQNFRTIAVKELDKENAVLGGNRVVLEIDES
jgi:transposase-like protein